MQQPSQRPILQASAAVVQAKATPGVSSSPAMYPMGSFNGMPVWEQQPGGSNTFFGGGAVTNAAAVQAMPQPQAAASYTQMRYQQMQPAASLVQRVLMARQVGVPTAFAGVPVPQGITGDAAAQYGAAYGAAFASTYNSLVAQGGATAVKQQALQRLQNKAASEQALPPVRMMQTRLQVQMPQPGWRMPPLARTGTAVVEQALMTPGEMQQQQTTNYNGPSINIMSATGGPSVALNSEEQSAFRIDSKGQISDSETERPSGTDSAPSSAGEGVEAAAVPVESSNDPLGAAQGAVAEAAASMQVPARMTSLSEMV